MLYKPHLLSYTALRRSLRARGRAWARTSSDVMGGGRVVTVWSVRRAVKKVMGGMSVRNDVCCSLLYTHQITRIRSSCTSSTACIRAPRQRAQGRCWLQQNAVSIVSLSILVLVCCCKGEREREVVGALLCVVQSVVDHPSAELQRCRFQTLSCSSWFACHRDRIVVAHSCVLNNVVASTVLMQKDIAARTRRRRSQRCCTARRSPWTRNRSERSALL